MACFNYFCSQATFTFELQLEEIPILNTPAQERLQNSRRTARLLALFPSCRKDKDAIFLFSVICYSWGSREAMTLPKGIIDPGGDSLRLRKATYKLICWLYFGMILFSIQLFITLSVCKWPGLMTKQDLYKYLPKSPCKFCSFDSSKTWMFRLHKKSCDLQF